MPGILYLVPTPIGNLGDISPRAAKTLEEADFIAAEDTRVTGGLLRHLGLRREQVSYYEHNRAESGEKIIARIMGGESCALCTDAGTPAISDPGEDLVRLACENGITVVPLAGPCALVCAVAASGIASGRFCFEGFLSVNRGARRAHLAQLEREVRTMVFYEAPHKLMNTLGDLRETFGDRNIAVCRELTKLHEEIIRTTISGAIAHFEKNAPRGEFVLVIEGAPPQTTETPFEQALELAKRYRAQGKSTGEAASCASRESGHPRNKIYKALI